MDMRHRFPKARNSQPGQALVEFGLMLPVMLILFLGIIDFGRAFYAGVVAEQAARDAARLGMGSAPDTGVVATSADCAGVNPATPCTPITTQVLNDLGLGTGGTSWIGVRASDVTVYVGGREVDGTTYGHYLGA